MRKKFGRPWPTSQQRFEPGGADSGDGTIQAALTALFNHRAFPSRCRCWRFCAAARPQ